MWTEFRIKVCLTSNIIRSPGVIQKMEKKQHHILFEQLFGANKGVWTLILVHLAILTALVTIFHTIIEKLDGF